MKPCDIVRVLGIAIALDIAMAAKAAILQLISLLDVLPLIPIPLKISQQLEVTPKCPLEVPQPAAVVSESLRRDYVVVEGLEFEFEKEVLLIP